MSIQEKINDTAADIKNGNLSPDWVAVDSKDILAIAEAFRALEQRAEAAEAKLAELEKQPPVAWTDEQELRDVKNHGCGYLFTVDPVTPNADPRRIIKLFTRAVPAINLAELVPNEERIHNEFDDWREGWNACRAAILRNIEEAK